MLSHVGQMLEANIPCRDLITGNQPLSRVREIIQTEYILIPQSSYKVPKAWEDKILQLSHYHDLTCRLSPRVPEWVEGWSLLLPSPQLARLGHPLIPGPSYHPSASPPCEPSCPCSLRVDWDHVIHHCIITIGTCAKIMIVTDRKVTVQYRSPTIVVTFFMWGRLGGEQNPKTELETAYRLTSLRTSPQQSLEGGWWWRWWPCVESLALPGSHRPCTTHQCEPWTPGCAASVCICVWKSNNWGR